MIATFIIELILLGYTLVRYKLNSATRLIAALVFFLAVFQFAEYNVCGGSTATAEIWTRIGFIAITALPALGLHLSLVIAKRCWLVLRVIMYATALGFILVFALSHGTFISQVCGGNYVIFRLEYMIVSYYYFYYYSWLLITILLCIYFIKKSREQNIREALMLIVIGYMVFLLPTTIFNTVKPITKAGVPSIMCGFAIIFAFILVFGIIPSLKPLKRKLPTRFIDKK